MRWFPRKRNTETTVAPKEVALGISDMGLRIATGIAEHELASLDPDLIRYLASSDRKPSPDQDNLLLAERLSLLSASRTERLIAAVAALESTVNSQAKEIGRFEASLSEVRQASVSRLAVSGICVGIMVASAGVVAAIAQVLQLLGGR